MKAPLASLRDPGPPEVVVSRTHSYTHTHTYLLSRVGAVHRFVSYFTGHKPALIYTKCQI